MNIIFLLIPTVFLLTNAQDESGDAPCVPSDTVCWALKSNEYTNRLRAEKSVGPVSLGTEYMLDNALAHSVEQDKNQTLYHQPLGDGVSVGTGTGCAVMLMGENVAHFTADDHTRNYAWQCVMVQWRNSEGHYNNIIRERFTVGMNGIYKAPNGRVTCTQTFVQRAFDGLTGKCRNVGELTAAAAPTTPSSSSSTPSPSPSLPTFFDESGLTPCLPNDTVCWAVKSNEYTNRLRAEKGINSVSLGTEYMLDNAVAHSEGQDQMQSLYHQDLGAGLFLGKGTSCEVQVMGENVAYFTGSTKNYAWQCVMIIWRNSEGHYSNIIRERFTVSTNGIFVGSDGRVTCTQTFVQTTFDGLTGKCRNVGKISPSLSPSPSPTASPPPTPSSSSSPTASPSLTPSSSAVLTVTPATCRNFKIPSFGVYGMRFLENQCRYCYVSLLCIDSNSSVWLDATFRNSGSGNTVLEPTTNPVCVNFTSRNLGSWAMRFVNGVCMYCNPGMNYCFSTSYSKYLDNVLNRKS